MKDRACKNCKFYSALDKPRERIDGSVIYGYCFERHDKGLPVFIEGGFCNKYKGKPKATAVEADSGTLAKEREVKNGIIR